METTRTPLRNSLAFRVFVGVAFGVVLGLLVPDLAKQLKPLGTGFIKLIRMLIAPIIFGTVVTGIAKMGDMKRVGRVGVKALVYFEAVTTLALGIGLAVAHLARPGDGLHADPAALDTSGLGFFIDQARHASTEQFLMNIIPSTMADAFARGDILQVLLVSCLVGFALAHMGPRGQNVLRLIDEGTQVLFVCIGYVMKLAPLGAMGAMAFAVGSYGFETLKTLGLLLACVYGAAIFFVAAVLGVIARLAGFSLWRFLRFIKEEILIVLGTSSSETVLPRLLAKLESAGCSKPVVGLVVPTGYTFNLDGTSIYLTLAALFIAQATDTPLTWEQEATIVGVLLLTSKGAAAVAGGGFICLAATLSAVPALPMAGLSLLLGVDWFMATCRALTNMIGNGVACIVVAGWERSLDRDRLALALAGSASPGDPPVETDRNGPALPVADKT